MTADQAARLPFPLAPVTVVTGHYGVGKTNFALNLALDAAAAGYRVTLADMDVVNPYFRSNEYRDLLEEAGVRLIAPVFGHAFPFFQKEKGGKAITASFGVLLGLFPEMRPAVYLAFFFIFFSLIVVVSPHSFRSVVTFGLFAFCVLFTVKVPSIQIGGILITAIVIYRHFIKYLGEPLHIRLFKHTA